MQGLLKLALEYSGKPYRYETTAETYTKQRMRESVSSGQLSLFWGGTSEDLERNFIPIRIPAFKGLMGHRVFVIRQGNQYRFDDIHTLKDLSGISFGQGRTWQDVKLLESAGLKVITTSKKKNLFYMLEGGRFDAFPRGVNEAWREIATFPELPLAVENNLVLVYPLPTYFFVNKNSIGLAKDIESGLESAIKDGSFDSYFFGSDEIKSVLLTANLSNRRPIRIDNPYLPKSAPVHRKELWLTISDLQNLENTNDDR